MRLVILTHGFPTDSNPTAANFLLPFLDEILKKGHKVCVLTPRMGTETPLAQSYPVKVFSWKSNRLMGQLKMWKPSHLLSLLRFLISQKRALFDLYEREAFDHVLVVWAVPNAVAARSLKNKKGVGYSTWSLGTDVKGFDSNPFTRSLLKSLFHFADHLFANSHELCATINDLTGRETVFVPTYRPLETPSSEHFPALKKKAFHFLCVARLEPVKGPDLLLQAFLELISSIPPGREVELHYLGDGSMRQELEKRIRENRAEDRVHLHGLVSPLKVAAFLKVVDCLVLPSRSESMPVAFWEAQAAGIPVIGSDVGDLGRSIREFGQGIVVEAGNVEKLIAAMRKALDGGRGILQPNNKAEPPNPRNSALKFLETIERAAGK